jgi:hypothetical protein
MYRPYYSVRTGKNELTKYDLQVLLRLFRDFYQSFAGRYYFQEAFGYYCVDSQEVPGSLGNDIEAQIFRRIRKENLYPIQDKCSSYSEEDLFDIVEFLYDIVSKPVEGWFHSFSQCGWHYQTFDKSEGQNEYRNEINQILSDYSIKCELSKKGEIVLMADDGLQDLLEMKLPTYDKDNVEEKVVNAIEKYRSRHSSIDDKKDAIRDLADVLEFLRNEMTELIKNGYLTNNDEKDIFELANKYGLRHHDGKQKLNYEKGIWYPWMFFYYLSTIHAVVALIAREKKL